MGHIEQGRCRNKKDPTASIKQSDFCDQVNRKTIVKEVLKHHGTDFESFSARLANV